MNINIAMQTIYFLVLATAIAALIAGLNVSQVAHAQSKGTCQVGSNANGNPTSNPTSGNPHCFDPEQQPTGTTATPAQSLPNQPAATGTCTTNPCTTAGGGGNHPQSINPQDKIVGNPHEESPGSGCSATPPTPSCSINPQGSVVGSPHSSMR
jgi:hypothetical protein